MATETLKKSYQQYKIPGSFPIEPFTTISGYVSDLGSVSLKDYASAICETLHRHSSAAIDTEETILDEACDYWAAFPQFIRSQKGRTRRFSHLYDLPGDLGITMTGFQEWIDLNQTKEPNAEIWRGTLSPVYERRVIFSQKLSIKTASLPRWKPQIIVDRHTVEGEDE
jgi:hypothetical protein